MDDLPNLRQLWAKIPGGNSADLEKRITEFQVIETGEGQLAGCVGLRIESAQGQIHSEVYVTEPTASELRPIIWQRLLTLGRNYSLIRFWMAGEKAAPFWRSHGFEEASPEALRKLPGQFDRRPDTWLTLKLREENITAISVEHEFDIFKQHQRELSQRALRQARVFKVAAWVLLGSVLLVLALFAWHVFRHVPKLR